MALYKYLREAWKKPRENPFYQQRLIQWRTEPVTLKIPHPTRLDRARSLGYKAKPGYIVVRQRVNRHKRQHASHLIGGRRSRASSYDKELSKNYRQVAEERAVQNYSNCEVLNSYLVGEDGRHYWFEVILVDRAHPQILSDPRISWIATQRGRASRGLTSAGLHGRGLRNKGKGAEKLRPSRRANLTRRGKALTPLP
ncbi:50S ribosomal protein L15e [Candidatus Woesearchaeota archaeon]|nr:50S ribosomal protein L15e [Candidatus Woesearchaeota archaeon]